MYGYTCIYLIYFVSDLCLYRTQARKIDLIELTLLFGGTERCKLLKKTFEKFLDLSDNLILFCLTEEWSQNVVNLFKKLKFEKYFASKVGKRTLRYIIFIFLLML